MLQELAVPFVDARPEQLSLQLGLPRQTAIEVVTFSAEDVTVELRLLGGSHQVVIESGNRMLHSETVACLPGGGALPRRVESAGYTFDCDVQTLAGRYDAEVHRLASRMAINERSLGGRFPGDAMAMTGIELLHLDRHLVRWQTWHSYPKECTIVLTRSALALRYGV